MINKGHLLSDFTDPMFFCVSGNRSVRRFTTRASLLPLALTAVTWTIYCVSGCKARMVKVGCELLMLVRSVLSSVANISKRKFCGRPPLNPSKHVICSDSDDWCRTLQFVTGSGLSITNFNHHYLTLIDWMKISSND